MDSKISRIKFLSSSGKDNLKFEYDAMGNRVAKYVMQGQTEFPKHVTFYVRDASGNVMAVYEHDLELPESYHLSERHIYGSSRIGMVTKKVELNYTYSNNASVAIDQEPLAVLDRVDVVFTTSLGYKQYELTNHLGNVLAVIGDQKLPVLQGGVVVRFEAHVISSQDYSPFGVTLSGRSWTEGYRYGFQNQETDEEIWGGAINYKYRIEDPRLGRFFSVDPLFRDFPIGNTRIEKERMRIKPGDILYSLNSSTSAEHVQVVTENGIVSQQMVDAWTASGAQHLIDNFKVGDNYAKIVQGNFNGAPSIFVEGEHEPDDTDYIGSEIQNGYYNLSTDTYVRDYKDNKSATPGASKIFNQEIHEINPEEQNK